MNELHSFLATVWFALLGTILALYVLLDGSDLGIGILSLLEKRPFQRVQMLAPLICRWRAHELWLLLAGGVLFGAFPLAFSAILHTLYLPLILLLGALITRTAALMRSPYARNPDRLLRVAGWASLLAVAAQGLILGATLYGLPDSLLPTEHFSGEWATLFSLTVSISLICGYLLLGSTHLLTLDHHDMAPRARRWASRAIPATLLAPIGVLLWMSALHGHLLIHWTKTGLIPAFAALLLAQTVVSFLLLRSLRQAQSGAPFFWSALIFLLASSILTLGLYPDIIPGYLSLEQAATASRTLVFMTLGIGLLMPPLLAYNGFHHVVFGKRSGTGETQTS